jgi:hypothetical protein
MRRRATQLIVVMATALLVATGVALAASVNCAENPKTANGSTSTTPCKGTSSDDTITGTEFDDYIVGSYGNDQIDGLGGKDKLYGGYNDDTINGDTDNDYIDGSYNNDTIDGADGDDIIYGGPNRDTIEGGAGVDTIRGDNEVDSINAADGEVDFINCGTGTDKLQADAYDDGTPLDKNADGTPLNATTSSCENPITWLITSTPPIETTPLKVDFDAKCPGGSSQNNTVGLTLKAGATTSIPLSSGISGPDASSFSIPEASSSITLDPGAKPVEVPVTFTPLATSGKTWTGRLDLKASGKTVATVPLSAVNSCYAPPT